MSRIRTIAAFFVATATWQCSAAQPPVPEPAGVSSRAFVGDAELEVRYRYLPRVGKELVLYVDAEARRGATGPVRLSLQLEGFSVVRGQPTWEANVSAFTTDTHEVVLRATERVPKVTIVTHHIKRDIQLASDDIRFWVDEDGVLAECFPEVEACQEG